MDADKEVTQDELLQALLEARANLPEPRTSLVEKRLAQARKLFRAARQADQPPIRTKELMAVFGWNEKAARVIIVHLCECGDVQKRTIDTVNSRGRRAHVPAYEWTGDDEDG